MRIFVIFLLFGSLSSAIAYDGKLFSLAAGAKLSNNLARRGTTLYDGFQISPVIYAALFDDRIQFFGNSLEGNQFIVDDVLRARTKIVMVSDRPFIKTSGGLTARNNREKSWEWVNTLEWFIPSKTIYIAQLDLDYSKDLKAHWGNQIDLTARVTLGKFWLENDVPRIQPQLFATLGWGDTNHNTYQYGTGAEAPGFNYVEYGLMVVAPARIDPHFSVFRLYRYDLLGQNQSGSLASGTHGYQISATIAIGIL